MSILVKAVKLIVICALLIIFINGFPMWEVDDRFLKPAVGLILPLTLYLVYCLLTGGFLFLLLREERPDDGKLVGSTIFMLLFSYLAPCLLGDEPFERYLSLTPHFLNLGTVGSYYGLSRRYLAKLAKKNALEDE